MFYFFLIDNSFITRLLGISKGMPHYWILISIPPTEVITSRGSGSGGKTSLLKRVMKRIEVKDATRQIMYGHRNPLGSAKHSSITSASSDK